MLLVDGEVAVADPIPGGERGLVERAVCRCCRESIERAVEVEFGELAPAGEWFHVVTFREGCG